MTITMSFSGIGFGFLNYNFISDLSKIISMQIFKNHCITVSMRSLLIMRYLLDRKQLISANIWPYNKWNDSRKNCKTIVEFPFAFGQIMGSNLNITLYMEYIYRWLSLQALQLYKLTLDNYLFKHWIYHFWRIIFRHFRCVIRYH